jgi:pyruvate dehydrogenase E1 component beta subunit
MKSSIRDNDPVMFMENTLLYGERGEVPEEEYLIPLGVAEVKREGTDVSLIAHGRSALIALKAAEILEAEHKINAEVVDLRSIRPLDQDAFSIPCGRRIAPSWWMKTRPFAASLLKYPRSSWRTPSTSWMLRFAA